MRSIIKEEKIDITTKEVEDYLKEVFGEKLDEKNYTQFVSQIENGLKLNKLKRFLIENNS